MPSRKASDQGHKEKKENPQASYGRSPQGWAVRFGRLTEPDSRPQQHPVRYGLCSRTRRAGALVPGRESAYGSTCTARYS